MNLSIELGEKLAEVECESGSNHRSAYGFIYKDGDAFGLYFALLHIERQKPLVGLTLSIGKWWDDEAIDERSWVFLNVWSTPDSFHMGLMAPGLSRHFGHKDLGAPLDRQAALASPLRDQFFAIADFIVENDPAVNSYLNTGVIDEAKWEQQRVSQS
jgi:hypothetical protein